MENVDQKTIVKRIAKAWKHETTFIDHANDPDRRTMLAFRESLEMCGLTLNEIISLGNADDLNKAVDELFSKSQTKYYMTSKELLTPRYKVIADYPHMETDQIGVGDIVSPYGMGFMYPDKMDEFYSKYPHLFKKLEWYEERKTNELPMYVKNEMSSYVFKVKEWKEEFGEFKAFQFLKDHGISASWCNPITEKEYKKLKNEWAQKLNNAAQSSK